MAEPAYGCPNCHRPIDLLARVHIDRDGQPWPARRIAYDHVTACGCGAVLAADGDRGWRFATEGDLARLSDAQRQYIAEFMRSRVT